MAFALQCLDRNRPIRSRGIIFVESMILSRRGAFARAARIGECELTCSAAGTTPQCGADGQQSSGSRIDAAR